MHTMLNVQNMQNSLLLTERTSALWAVYGYFYLDIVIIILVPVWFDVGAAEHFNFIIPVLKVLHSTAAQQRKSFGFSCRL